MTSRRSIWTLAIVSIALFMVTLDNLVVTTALPTIRADLGASLESLEWTVNAYTLAFAVLLLTGAALGDRFGRRRMFVIGLGIFTAASAAAALAPTHRRADRRPRASRALGAAIVAAAHADAAQRGVPGRASAASRSASGRASAASASRSARSSAAPSSTASRGSGSSGSTCRSASSLAPARRARCLSESHGPARRLDLPRPRARRRRPARASSTASCAATALGWTSPDDRSARSIAGALLLAAFVAWELRAPAPMLPMRFFRSRAFAATNGVSLAMYFGIFGSIFLLAQFFQTVQGYSPLEAGLRTLPWTGMPMFVAPIAGAAVATASARGR